MGGREAWLDLLLVCGRESEGHTVGQTFSLCMGEREAWLDLLLVCGRESEGRTVGQTFSLCTAGREGHCMLGPFSCAQDRERGIDVPFPLARYRMGREAWLDFLLVQVLGPAMGA